ncbi:MAG: 3D domain-containing protein [Candidatus Hydrogenedentales bacterium]
MKAKPGTVAAPPSIPFGALVDVPGYGRGRVEDRGGAIQENRLDVYFKSHRRALEWGRRNLDVVVWLPASSIEAG